MDAMVRQGISSLIWAFLICACLPSESKRACVAHWWWERTVSASHPPDLQPFCSQVQWQALCSSTCSDLYGDKFCVVWLMFMLGVAARGVTGDMHNINEAICSEIRLSPKKNTWSVQSDMLNGYAARRAQRDNYISNTALLKNTLLWDRSLISTNVYFKTSTFSALICYKTVS